MAFLPVYLLEGVVGVHGHMVDWFSKTNGRFSSDGHRGSVAPVRAPLGCGSIHPGSTIRGWGAQFVPLGAINKSPIPSRRPSHAYNTDPKVSAVCATSHPLGVWETQYLSSSPSLSPVLVVGACVEVDSTRSKVRQQLKATQTMLALGPALFVPLLCRLDIRTGGRGGVVPRYGRGLCLWVCRTLN